MRFNWFFIIIILTTPFEGFSQNRKAQRAYVQGIKELTKSNADYSKAERFFQKAVRVYPEFSQALISLGDLKYTTLSFKTLRTVKVVSAINVKNTMMNTNLNLTFLLYISLN